MEGITEEEVIMVVVDTTEAEAIMVVEAITEAEVIMAVKASTNTKYPRASQRNPTLVTWGRVFYFKSFFSEITTPDRIITPLVWSVFGLGIFSLAAHQKDVPSLRC